eukprot:SAG31_NODE_16970_length_688_cov_1.178268_1_plen_106_part_01
MGLGLALECNSSSPTRGVEQGARLASALRGRPAHAVECAAARPLEPTMFLISISALHFGLALAVHVDYAGPSRCVQRTTCACLCMYVVGGATRSRRWTPSARAASC